MKTRLGAAAAVFGMAVLSSVSGAAARPADERKPPAQKEKRLSDGERKEVLELINLVDLAAVGRTPLGEAPPWKHYTLKASAGLGYVPLEITVDVPADAFNAVAMYVRVVSPHADEARTADRSVLRQWLIEDAARGVPRPVRGFMAVNPDEMPMGGPAAGSRRGLINAAQGSTTALTMLREEAEREKARGAHESNDEKEKGKKSEATKRESETFVYPFEDFDFVELADSSRRQDATIRTFARAVAVPAGQYDLYLAIRERPGKDKKAPLPRTAVYRQSLSVPNLSAGFTISSVIVADRLATLPVPYTPEEQAAHPFALGWTEALPAADRRFADTEQLGIVFQVLNAAPDPRRKPDVMVEYLFHRKSPAGESLETSARQNYNRSTLPPEFDLAAGHQLLAAQAVPLKAFPPGDYRLELKVTDRRASKVVGRDVEFTVTASRDSLWVNRTVSELLAPPFRREDALLPAMIEAALGRLETVDRAPMPPTAAHAIASARAGQFANLLTDVSVIGQDELSSSFLRGLALLGLNGSLEAAAGQFRAARQHSADFWPATFYLGVCHAAQGRDREAQDVWNALPRDEVSLPLVPLLAAEAHLRTNQPSSALDLLNDAQGRWPEDERLAKRAATAHVLAHENAAAFQELQRYLDRRPGDVEALFLVIHLLHQAQIGGPALGKDVHVNERMPELARAYARANGPHQVLVEQWVSEIGEGGYK